MNVLHNLILDSNFSAKERKDFLKICNNNHHMKGGAIPLELTREKVIELVNEYGPINYMHKDANIFPINIEEYWDKYRYEKRNDLDYMVETDNLSSPSDTLPWYFTGSSNLKNVKSYVFVRSIPDGFSLSFVLFWPFNRGKNAFNTSFGNHSGDITVSWIYFSNDYKPFKIGCQHHSSKSTWNWKQHEREGGMQQAFDRNNIYQEYVGNHPVFYNSIRGNETYPFEPRYTYVNKPLLKLRDYMGKGFRYDSFNKFLIIMPQNLYGYDNIAYDNQGNKFDLAIPNTPIKNWIAELEYFGRESMGRVKIGKLVDQYRRSGPVHMKQSEMKIDDKRTKQDIETLKYLEAKKK